MKIMNNVKNILPILAIGLLIVGVGVGAAYKSHAFAASNNSTSDNVMDAESNDDHKSVTQNNQDNGKDGETNDDTNAADITTHTQDNGQDGETNDSPNQ